MSHSRNLGAPVFETQEEELNFWKESYHELIERHQVILRENRRLSLLNSHTDELPPAKKARIKNESMDPLNWLKEDELQVIMKNLNSTELLKLMEVSKEWKKFIEGQSLLMNCAMAGIVFKPQSDASLLPLAHQMFSDTNYKRPYKHMKSAFTISLSQCVKALPIHFHASSLVSLELDDSNCKEEVAGCEFPQLSMLKYKGHRFHLFKDFSFPLLTHLELADSGYLLTFETHKESLQKFPKLKFFLVSYWGLCYRKLGNDIERIAQEDPRHVPITLHQPAIEQTYVPAYHSRFINQHQFSLKVLELGFISVRELSWVFRDLLQLKSLTIFALKPGDEEVEQNASIETLKIKKIMHTPRRRLSTLLYTSYEPLYQRIFLALPSLNELVTSDAVADMIEFIASHMTSLKKLTSTCEWTYDAAKQIYHQIQSNPLQYKNSTFEWTNDPDYNFREIEKKFK